MKIKVQAQFLQPGDIVGSGEVVQHIIGRALRLPSNKVSVTLKKNGHQRTVYWGKYTQIGVERADAPKQEDDDPRDCYSPFSDIALGQDDGSMW